MKSTTSEAFWRHFRNLPIEVRRQAREAYRLWLRNPYHPSLKFKKLEGLKNLWSVRITLSYRAVGTLHDGELTWFWIGSHDAYEKLIRERKRKMLESDG